MLRKTLIVLSLLSLVACNGGGGGSGGSSVRARLIDAPVQGVEYINTDGGKDITEIDGGFYCKSGSKVQFFVGKIKLGNPISCVANSLVYPQDLVGDIRGNFDTASQSVKVVAFLLSAAAKTPETWNFGNPAWEAQCEAERQLWLANPNVGGSNDCNPPQLMITQLVRVAMATSTFTKVPENDAQLLVLINEVRDSLNMANVDAVQLQTILDSSKKHLEISLLEHSGIVNDDVVVADEDETEAPTTVNVVSLSALSAHILANGSDEIIRSIPAKCLDFSSNSISTVLGNPAHVRGINDVVSLCASTANHATNWYYPGQPSYDESFEDMEMTVVIGDVFPKVAVFNAPNNFNAFQAGYVQSLVLTSGIVDHAPMADNIPDRVIPSLRGKFVEVNGEIQWFRSCNDEAIAGLTLTNVCTNPESFNPIN